MTDTTTPTLFSPPARARTWRVRMADGSERTITASACRTEHGALLFCEPAGLVFALAAGTWTSVEMVPAP